MLFGNLMLIVLNVPMVRVFVSLLRVPTLEPTRGTRAHVGALLDSSPDVATLIQRLGADAPR